MAADRVRVCRVCGRTHLCPRCACVLCHCVADLLVYVRLAPPGVLAHWWPRRSSSWSGWLACRAQVRRDQRSRNPRRQRQWGSIDLSPPDTLTRLQSCPGNCRHGGGWCLEDCQHTGCRDWRNCCHSASYIAMMISEGPRKQEQSLEEEKEDNRITNTKANSWLRRCYRYKHVSMLILGRGI